MLHLEPARPFAPLQGIARARTRRNLLGRPNVSKVVRTRGGVAAVVLVVLALTLSACGGRKGAAPRPVAPRWANVPRPRPRRTSAPPPPPRRQPRPRLGARPAQHHGPAQHHDDHEHHHANQAGAAEHAEHSGERSSRVRTSAFWLHPVSFTAVSADEFWLLRGAPCANAARTSERSPVSSDSWTLLDLPVPAVADPVLTTSVH